MVQGDLVPQLLATIATKAIPEPPTGNEALNLFNLPLDTITLSDLVSAANERRPFVYGGSSLYAESLYTSRVALTLSGNEITDAERLFALTWGLGQNGGSTDGATVPGGVGIWESGTNLFRHGQCDTNGDRSGTDVGVTIGSPDTGTPAPFSPQSIPVTTDGTAANQGVVCTSATGLAAAAATKGVGRPYVKGAAGSSYRVLLEWGNTDASTTDGTVLTFTASGGWDDPIPSALAVASGKTGDSLRVIVTVNGTRAETFHIAHEHLQKGVGVVSPYVATSGGATATRAAAQPTAPRSLADATQFWIAFRFVPGWTTAPPHFSALLNWESADYPPSSRLTCSISFGPALRIQRMSPSGLDDYHDAGHAWTAGVPVTLIYRFTATDMGVSFGGSAFTSWAATAANIPTNAALTSALQICRNDGVQAMANGQCLWAACGTGTLSDADAATINAFGNTPPDLSQLPNASVPTMVWPGVSDFAYAGP